MISSHHRIALSLAFLALAAGARGLIACSAGQEPEAATLPPNQYADYLVFAQRCSKCHSLARPLNSGIDSDEYWKLYVERMRLQPGSGISVADTIPILRFLHGYSLEQRKKKELALGEHSNAPAVPTAPLAASSVTPDATAPPASGRPH